VHPRDEIAERREPTLRLAKRYVEMIPGSLGVSGELGLGELKIDHRGDELLLRAVVEVTGEPLTSAIRASENPPRGLPTRVVNTSYLRLSQ
jgi:hypothetical protein